MKNVFLSAALAGLCIVSHPVQANLPGQSLNRSSGYTGEQEPFSLDGVATFVTFQSLRPVDGDVYLYGTQVDLEQDLVFSGSFKLMSAGHINGQGHSVVLGPATTEIPSDYTSVMQDLQLILGGDVAVKSRVEILGDVVLNGSGNRVVLEEGGSLNIMPNSRLLLRNVDFSGLAGTNFSFADASSKLICEKVEWSLADDYFFENGSFEIKNKFRIKGGKTFSYRSGQESLVHRYSHISFSDQSTFLYDPIVPDYGYFKDYESLLVFEDKTSRLVFSDANLSVSDVGFCLKKGTLDVSENVTISLQDRIDPGSGATIGGGLVLGSFDPGHYHLEDGNFMLEPLSICTVSGGSLYYRCKETSAWRMKHKTSHMIFKTGSKFKLYHDVDLQDGHLIFEKYADIFQRDGAILKGSVSRRA